MKASRYVFVCAGLLFAAPGCAVLGGGAQPLDTYELTAPTADISGPRRRWMQILVAEPTAIKVLDGQNIVVKPGPRVVQFLEGAQWADRLPRVIQAELVETYQASDRFGGVGKPGEGLAIDYQVVIDVRAFEVRVEGQARAEIELYVRLLNDRNGVVRAARTFTASALVLGEGNDAFVGALDQAFQVVAEDIVRWTVRAL